MTRATVGFFTLFCTLYLFAQANTPITKEALGPAVNSKYDELAPILSPDGQTLYFCREGDPNNVGIKKHKDDQDIWVSRKDKKGRWKPAQHLAAVFNSEGHDFPIGTSSDGKTLYIGQTYDKKGIPSPGGVSRTRKLGKRWTFPEALKIRDYYNSAPIVNYSVGADEKTLILNLQRKDTRGKMDLYVSFLKEDSTWSIPLNLGNNVNSGFMDVTPFLAADMKTLYFSSNRKGGEGGFDMYVTRRRTAESWQKWTVPENLGPKLNTPGNDISYTISQSGEFAVFASETKDSGKDLYVVTLPKKFRPKRSVVFEGVVKTDTGNPKAARILYERLSDGKSMGQTVSDPKTGIFKITLPVGEKYSLRAKKKHFVPVTELIDLTNKIGKKRVELILHPLKTGAKITLKSIFFQFQSAKLSKASYSELNRLVKIMKENSSMRIEVGGHTDSLGATKYNWRLSQRRANSVRNYLVKNGISKKRIRAKGYGESKPIASNRSKAGRTKNRRVEFTIMSK